MDCVVNRANFAVKIFNRYIKLLVFRIDNTVVINKKQFGNDKLTNNS